MTFTTINREDLAWAAGLFEGEGCFSYSSKYRSLAACVVSTDLDVLQKFHMIVGFGRINKPVQPPKDNPHWKVKWSWSCSNFEEVQALTAFLWSWLHSRRRARITSILKTYLADVPKSFYESRDKAVAIKAALSGIANEPLWGRRWRSGRTQKSIALDFGVSPSRVTQLKQEMAG